MLNTPRIMLLEDEEFLSLLLRYNLETEGYQVETEIDERTVDVHVGRLRRALNGKHDRDPIRIVRGAGYSFDETFGLDNDFVAAKRGS